MASKPLLTLSALRVEVRLYRSSRTASDFVSRPAHFMYCLHCRWVPSQDEDADGPLEEWWRALPASYVVRRSWADVCQFHRCVRRLAHDPELGCTRVKAKLPDLPAEGDLDQFVNGIAATGDASVMCRPHSRDRQWATRSGGGDPYEDLDDIHKAYVENRLRPYFADVTKVISELPLEILQASAGFRNFVTAGMRLLAEQGPLESEQRFLGPAPLMLDWDVARDVFTKLRKKSQAAATRDKDGLKEEAASVDDRSLPPIGRRPMVASPTGAPPELMLRSASDSALVRQGMVASPTGRAARAAESQPVGPRLTKEEKRVQRLQNSHYGYFAKALRAADSTGAPSSRDFWRTMAQKEKREIGRRTMLNKDSAAWHGSSTSIERLPTLPPGASEEDPARSPNRSPTGGWSQRDGHELNASVGCTGESWRSRGSKEPARPMKRVKSTMGMTAEAAKAQIWENLCEGLRVLILHEKPAAVPRHMRKVQSTSLFGDARVPTEDETLKVYELYCKLLRMGGGRGGYLIDLQEEDEDLGLPDAEAEELRSKSTTHTGNPHPKGLPFIAWNTLLAWSQHREDIAFDFRYKSATALLNRSLQAWMQAAASEQEKEAGMPLNLLFRWVWPTVADENLTAMLRWIYLYELESVRQPTPQVIDAHERRILGKIWTSMDPDGTGFCTVDDIAGAREQTIGHKNRSVVDAATVEAVAGTGTIDELTFLELMCEDNFRAHEAARRVTRRDGAILMLWQCEVVDSKIWVLEDPPKEEIPTRRRLDAIEAEIVALSSESPRAAGSEELPVVLPDEEEEELSQTLALERALAPDLLVEASSLLTA